MLNSVRYHLGWLGKGLDRGLAVANYRRGKYDGGMLSWWANEKENMNDQKQKSSKRIPILFGVVIAVCVVGYLIADYNHSAPNDVERSFVGRQACISCHQEQADLFHGSHHDLAMDLATDETVLATFDGQIIEHYGVESRVFRDGDKFMVNTEGPDGEMRDYVVKYVFGVTPLQQYMVEIEKPKTTQVAFSENASGPVGRVQVLRLSWDTLKKEWFYLKPPDVDEKIEPGDPLHWTGITQSWNASCAECHSTNLQKNFDPLSRKYNTTFSEIDVSCEACHGPGSFHVSLANRKSLFWDRKHGFGLNKLKSTSNLPQIETCAPCHSRRTNMGEAKVGCNFDDHYACQLIADPVYHHDGQIRDEDYVYGSFIQSKMFHNGIKCTDCHDPHSTKVKFEGNKLCTSCHQHPAGKYDTPSHHHHQEGSKGALCVECHMPATTYMKVDARRDHSLRIPRPDFSVKYGTPNACTGCHLDKNKLESPDSRGKITQYLDWMIAREGGDEEVTRELDRVDQWMAEAFEKWYPEDKAPPRSKYYEALAIGNSENGLPTLMELALDRKSPAIFRASAMFGLAQDATEKSLEIAQQGIQDSDVKVVSGALMRLDLELGRIADRLRYQQSNDTSPYREVIEPLAKLLSHPSRRIRIEAVRVLASVPVEVRQRFCSVEQRRAYTEALDEYRRSLLVQNDRAMSHTMLAGLYELSGNLDKAMDAYRTAISVEPNITGPRGNLAAILDSQAASLQNQLRPQAGNSMMASQIEETAKRIGLIQEESNRLRREEHDLLRTDLERSANLAGTHALHYRFAMSSYLQKDFAATEKHLLEAHRQDSQSPTYLLGLAAYYQQVDQPQEAAKFVKKLLEVDPNHPGYRSLAAEVMQQLNQSPTSN